MAFPLMPDVKGQAPTIVVSTLAAHLRPDAFLAHRLPESVSLAFQYHSRLGPLLIHLSNNIDSRLDLAEAARIVHMERTAFSKFFRRATGITYREFLRIIRISKAAGLLLSCDASITEVALSVGYADPSLFGKHFRSLTGFRPNQYRHRSPNHMVAA